MCFINKSDITVHKTDCKFMWKQHQFEELQSRLSAVSFASCLKKNVYIKDYTSEKGEVTCRHYDKIFLTL